MGGILKRWDALNAYAPMVLRYGLAAVFLWFGINQLIDPVNFIGYLPGNLFSSSFATTFVLANGAFEIIAAGFLIVGKFVRLAAFLLALHLLGITFSLGYNDIAVRDAGLFLATLSLAMHGPDSWCIDNTKRIGDNSYGT